MSPADGKLAAASAGVADAGTVPGRTPRRLQLPVGPDGATAQGRPAGAPKQEKRRSTGAAAVAARADAAPSAGSLLVARLGGLGLGLLLAALLAAACLVMIWFNVSGWRQGAVRALKLDQASWLLLEERRAALDKATGELAAQKRTVDDDRLKYEGMAGSLQKREKDLDARQATIDERLRQLTGHELSLQALKAVYEGMDPAKAAAMAAAVEDRRQLATVLKALSQSRLSLILEQMPATVAAELIALMTPDLTQTPAAAPTGAPPVAKPTAKPTATSTATPAAPRPTSAGTTAGTAGTTPARP